MSACENPPCVEVGPFPGRGRCASTYYCPIKGCGWMEPPPRVCWTCGVALTDEEWRSAARERSNTDKRWCVRCHDRIEFSQDPLGIGNMLRHVGGLPLMPDIGSSSSEGSGH